MNEQDYGILCKYVEDRMDVREREDLERRLSRDQELMDALFNLQLDLGLFAHQELEPIPDALMKQGIALTEQIPRNSLFIRITQRGLEKIRDTLEQLHASPLELAFRGDEKQQGIEIPLEIGRVQLFKNTSDQFTLKIETDQEINLKIEQKSSFETKTHQKYRALMSLYVKPEKPFEYTHLKAGTYRIHINDTVLNLIAENDDA
jgi:hypothetical protein